MQWYNFCWREQEDTSIDTLHVDSSVGSGQTDWNVLGLVQSRTDVPLNDTGRHQAKLAGSWLKDEKYDKVFSSPKSRAFETANICMSQNIHGGEIIVDEAVTERDCGIFEGKPNREVLKAALASSGSLDSVKEAFIWLFAKLYIENARKK